MSSNLQCPVCGEDLRDDEEEFVIHTLHFHRPANGLHIFNQLRERSEHLRRVARGEEPLDKLLESFRGEGGQLKHAATLAKSRAPIVFKTEVAPAKSPPSDITRATPRKRR